MNDLKKNAPLYIQLRSYIWQQIQQQHWKNGDRLPTEKELAERFNVSRITIRNALQALVEDGFIYRIQGKGTFVAAERGRPAIADAASRDTPPCIAFLIPRLNNRITAQLLSSVEDVLSGSGFQLIFCKTHDSQQIEKQKIRELLRLGVKGFIIYPVEGESYNEEILQLTLSKFPVVVIDRYLRGIETNCVCSDNFGGAYSAIEHLIRSGHRKIAMVTSPYEGTTSLEDRLSGYERALEDHRLPVDRSLIFDCTDFSAIPSFLQDHPEVTAIFAGNTDVGVELVRSAERLGIGIPGQLAVVFYDEPEYPDLLKYPFTIIEQNQPEIGRNAARLLLSIMENPYQTRTKITVPTKLVVRA